ncbi:hypothetical protein C2E23DRAFT_895731, partial [Lenzites betulinus]
MSCPLTVPVLIYCTFNSWRSPEAACESACQSRQGSLVAASTEKARTVHIASLSPLLSLVHWEGSPTAPSDVFRSSGRSSRSSLGALVVSRVSHTCTYAIPPRRDNARAVPPGAPIPLGRTCSCPCSPPVAPAHPHPVPQRISRMHARNPLCGGMRQEHSPAFRSPAQNALPPTASTGTDICESRFNTDSPPFRGEQRQTCRCSRVVS